MKVLYVGESWQGSCARSLKEALQRRSDVEVEEVNEDLWTPRPTTRWLRATMRLLRPYLRRELAEEIESCSRRFGPDVIVVYKGSSVDETAIHALRKTGVLTVNVYPDCSPHAHGELHRRAVGSYDLVVSTKPYHPESWRSEYGYDNDCVFVPQGYDPRLHLVEAAQGLPLFDLVMVATWRAQYGSLILELSRRLRDLPLKVGLFGSNWSRNRGALPKEWETPGPVVGRAYVEALRNAKICIAPLHRSMRVRGRNQPGDVDTTRTYELAAAHTFFLHRRTKFVQELYDETSEVPMFEDASELASHIRHYLPREDDRRAIAARAHRRAVPAYSIDSRAAQILDAIRLRIGSRGR